MDVFLKVKKEAAESSRGQTPAVATAVEAVATALAPNQPGEVATTQPQQVPPKVVKQLPSEAGSSNDNIASMSRASVGATPERAR